MQGEADEFEEARRSMVETQLKSRGISDENVLNVMGMLPRHLFVEPSLQEQAYADRPLPIGEGQTISQPYVVALMTEALGLKGPERVLEIGTGSGYQAAVLAELCSEVYTIEIREGLAGSAEERLAGLGFDNVHVRCSDGYFGWEEHAPFDAIIITCAVNHVPPYLIQQLDDGGRLILPLGSVLYYQTLTLIEKQGEELDVTYITGVRFVPMTGEALEAGGE
ncbi:MAG: protein-L-isoaspartate(D-aspartate) O-methyltransferase [Candidatus Bathyarchaeota archaeon]|nr:MAG: protein-L-isoaspartate(D-aspartate) O-methyltransferase [Candidatus Bathyarchaeota archaeon]